MADKIKGARTFAAAFAGSVSEAIARAAGTEWPLQLMEGAEPPALQGKLLHFRLTLDGSLRGDCFVEFHEPQVAEVAARILGHPPVEDEGRDALAGVLASATAGLGQALAADYGEVTFRLDPVSGLAFGGMFVVPLAAPADPSGAPVLLYFDGRLLASMCGASASGPAAAAAGQIDPANLKLVMGVELSVSLRFGQRQLPLREVLELSSGSVIELDRMVDEPVELLLDGKVIARGDAVIVDGNYGLRVTEIPQPVTAHILQ